MSAYSASHPVMHRTTAPRVRKPARPWFAKNMIAYHGLIAASTDGVSMIERTPSTAMVTNQTSVIGPKAVPTRAVPKRWNMNSPKRITSVIGTTRWTSAGLPTSSPSTALRTEMAGVMTPSPASSDAPKRPNATSMKRFFFSSPRRRC